ncbi:MAG: serine/threonine phosphatase [Chloroflexi bacterium AL-N10]|nr:serine/threonine phosphatase [Chloroflexi bacterium AL-N10]NOK92783.1 serine/threonine phosphatase [Chloroflexi bacterium AL-N15]
MLVCPECQFENSDDLESCQECGTSLSHRNCPKCGELVSWNIDNCPSCGNFTANVWRGIITLQSSIHPQETDKEISPNIPSLADDYLDREKRYRLLNRNFEELLPQFLVTKVIDSFPLQKSKLDVALKQNPEILEHIAENSGQFSENIKNIPSIALSYLRLEEFYPLIPDVQDSWLMDNHQIILLSDRSNFPLLSDLISAEGLSLIDILYWFDEMLKPWKLLVKVGCCQSLLEVANLRVDEDESFCLQQLYFDPIDRQANLKNLVTTWKTLIANSSYIKHPLILKIFADLDNESITTVDQLHNLIQEIAIEEESSLTSLENSNYLSNQDRDPEEVESYDMPREFNLTNDIEDTPTVVLPMQLLSLTDAASTDIGLQRTHNEDFFGITTEIKKQINTNGKSIKAQGLYIVCDGMGGHDAGEVASAMAVETLQNYFKENWHNEMPDYDTIRDGILLANNRIYEVNKQNQRSGSGRMGTTMTMVLVQNTKVAVAHVGDSRIYRLTRKNGLEKLTLDHEVGQREILRGIEPDIAYARPDAFQLTQALGPRNSDFVEPEINFLEINEDTLLVLCSDGLSDNNLIEDYAEADLLNLISSNSNLDEGVLKLIDLANEYNGHDNISAILIRIKVRPNLQEQVWF